MKRLANVLPILFVLMIPAYPLTMRADDANRGAPDEPKSAQGTAREDRGGPCTQDSCAQYRSALAGRMSGDCEVGNVSTCKPGTKKSASKNPSNPSSPSDQ